MQRALAKLIAPLKRRVQLMVGRAVLSVIDDSTTMQSVQASLLADEVRDNVERFQEYGLTSVPLADAEALVVFVAGNRAHGIVVATDDRRYRPTGLNPGDVALYHTAGVRVYLDKDNDIVNLGALSAADFVALATSTKSEIEALRNTVNSHITAYNTHVHPGVTAGGAATAVTPSIATAPAAVGDVAATKVKAT